jgi:hypothetical protein
MIGVIAICAVLAVGMALVIHGTLVKNKWGINLDSVSCPRCNTVLPQVRKPRSLQQSVWGGWTCPNCGVGMDKWGREMNPTMEIPAKTGANDPSSPRKGWPWYLWLLVLLFPIPFSPWWLTIICLAVFCSLVYLFTREA